jgi:hypothetical protein
MIRYRDILSNILAMIISSNFVAVFQYPQTLESHVVEGSFLLTSYSDLLASTFFFRMQQISAILIT